MLSYTSIEHLSKKDVNINSCTEPERHFVSKCNHYTMAKAISLLTLLNSNILFHVFYLHMKE